MILVHPNWFQRNALLSIAPCREIALKLLYFNFVLVLCFFSWSITLYCSSIYRYYWSLEAIAIIFYTFSLSPLRTRKSNNYCYRNSSKNDNYREQYRKAALNHFFFKYAQNEAKQLRATTVTIAKSDKRDR